MTRLTPGANESDTGPRDPEIVFGRTAVSHRTDAGYLRVTCRGDFPARPYHDLLATIRGAATEAGMSRILVDAVAVAAPSAEIDRFWFGSAIAELFHAGDFKVALLVSFERIDKLGENTAVNRGARLLVTRDEAEALAWLVR